VKLSNPLYAHWPLEVSVQTAMLPHVAAALAAYANTASDHKVGDALLNIANAIEALLQHQEPTDAELLA
jgi:hypothetical protein